MKAIWEAFCMLFTTGDSYSCVTASELHKMDKVIAEGRQSANLNERQSEYGADDTTYLSSIFSPWRGMVAAHAATRNA